MNSVSEAKATVQEIYARSNPISDAPQPLSLGVATCACRGHSLM